jgi:hypothetical protein
VFIKANQHNNNNKSNNNNKTIHSKSQHTHASAKAQWQRPGPIPHTRGAHAAARCAWTYMHIHVCVRHAWRAKQKRDSRPQRPPARHTQQHQTRKSSAIRTDRKSPRRQRQSSSIHGQHTYSLLSSSISTSFWQPVAGYAILSCCVRNVVAWCERERARAASSSSSSSSCALLLLLLLISGW